MPEPTSTDHNPVDGFRAALQFLSRLPVSAPSSGAGASLPWYPVVGALLGGLALALGAFVSGAHPLLPAAVYVVALAALSGALHLDGLADTVDAWVGGLGAPERTLRIMKDAMVGPMGVTAIVGALLVKTGAAAVLFTEGATAALILAPALGRAAAAALLLGLPYVREAGLGTPVVEGMARRHVRYSLIATAVVALFISLPALLLAVAALAGLAGAFRQRLGGVTGDCAGATIELVETAALVGATFWLTA